METSEIAKDNEVELNPTPELKTFGAELRKARLEKNLSIAEIVAETRISKHVIEQIEAKNPVNLPEHVFLRGFIKAYAEIVGLNSLEIVEMYRTEYGLEEKSSLDVAEENVSKSSIVYGKTTHKAPIFIALIVIVILGVIFYSFSRPDTKTDSSVVSGLSDENVDNTDVDKKQTVEEYKLEVVCVEDTTVKISADGEQVAEHNLKPEEHVEFSAKKQFNILINNTCGVTLFLNNQPVNIPGKCGQTVNIQLPQQ